MIKKYYIYYRDQPESMGGDMDSGLMETEDVKTALDFIQERLAGAQDPKMTDYELILGTRVHFKAVEHVTKLEIDE